MGAHGRCDGLNPSEGGATVIGFCIFVMAFGVLKKSHCLTIGAYILVVCIVAVANLSKITGSWGSTSVLFC